MPDDYSATHYVPAGAERGETGTYTLSVDEMTERM